MTAAAHATRTPTHTLDVTPEESYNTVSAKWGKGRPSAEVIAAMPPKRQTLFRGVWHGMSDIPGINKYYEEPNTAV